ncbi:hypothetical protein PF008_g28108 [Phytophthora fragariae]|uniref:Uncharacterized protein n=1 Tax=Phytophthora fragariae TaxID=53985 RepID=A0A6G0QD25_9STRA|nr:hypothetical protein PF008_g28108 [Phytophthora fragariae]
MKRPYNGRCHYKTGKCFNERALKRNGTAHSLCEEHRRRQNLIQRRSDRKYQKVHAIRRRERTQRLKRQVSLTVARQLQQQQLKKFAMSQRNPPQGPAVNNVGGAMPARVTPGNVGVARSFVSDG